MKPQDETAALRTRLARRSLVLFGLPEYAVYLASIPVVLYLPFVYSKSFGLSLTDVGLILMVGRISDVVTDPLIGYLSDRTPGRFGKRKPWIAVGMAIMTVSAYMLFNPVATNVTNLYLLGWAMSLWLGWTMINIPYYAWGAELSDDYNERTRITAWRQLFGFLGNVSVLFIPVAAGHFTGYGSLPTEGLTIIGGMALIGLPLCITIALWSVPEPDRYGAAHAPVLTHFRLMRKNGSFWLLFFGFMLMSLGTGWGSATFMLFATYVVGAESQTQAILLGYYGANVLSLPLWVYLSERVGKKETWIIGGLMFVLVTPCFLLLGIGDLWWFFLILALYGIAGGNFAALSMSMKADVIEIAARRSKENVSGAYIAVWSLGQKMVIAIALGTALPLLGLLGFEPNVEHTPAQLRTLAYVYVIPPWLFYAAAVIVLWRYPINELRLRRLRTALEKRAERREQSLQTSG
jgi:Na+/melibiose symporter-like transporter